MERLAVVCALAAVAGIIILFLYSQSVAPRAIEQGDVEFVTLGSYVRINGAIERISGDKLLIITLCSYGPRSCADVHIFESLVSRPLFEGDSATAVGNVREYRGKRYVEVKSSGGLLVG
jgi:hypothetical protein